MGTNNFVALSVIPAGLNQPAESAAVDLYAVAPPNGFSPNGVSVILSGNFVGVIALVGSLDGTNYRPLTEGFNAGVQTDPSRPFSLEFPPQLFTDLVRYVKWKVLPNTKILTDVSITLGGELNCDCSGADGDGLVLVTGADTTLGFLSAKIDDGTGIAWSVVNPGANESYRGDLQDTAVAPGSYSNGNFTVDQQGRLTSAADGATIIGATGEKLVNIIPIPSGDVLEDSATPLVTGSVFFNPADYPLANTTRTIFFRAVAATGNGTVVGRVVLFDMTNSVTIKDFSFTSTSTTKLEQALTVSVPGANTIANADTKYEVRIFVDAPAVPTDFVELYSAEIRVINTIN